MSKYDIDKLNQFYREAEESDAKHFAKQRNNILLVSGKHYHQKTFELFERQIKESSIDNRSKIRLTKNHVQVITGRKMRKTLSLAPDARVTAKNTNELRDQKNAELNQAVWLDWKKQVDFKSRIVEYAKDFADLGEVAVELSFDPHAGTFLGYEGLVDEQGNAAVDEQGEQVADISKPVFLGKIVANRVWGFNLLRPASAKSMDTAQYLIVREMVSVSDLKKRIKAENIKDDERLKYIQESSKTTYTVFDGEDYNSSKGMLLLRKFYFRPSIENPEGYYIFATEQGTLWEGKLPDGIFPVIFKGYKEVQGNPRYNSIIDDIRPNQIEINRCASSLVYHQVVLGDDKVIQPAGSKLTTEFKSGIRTVSYTGKEPNYIQGRDGSQFIDSYKLNIDEMYQISDEQEDDYSVNEGAIDPYALLFRSAQEKEKFAIYASQFQSFIVELCEKVLRLAKYCYSDEQLLRAIGKPEIDNIPEFRTSDDLSYSIIVEPSSGDSTTLVGRMLGITTQLQYLGASMDEDMRASLVENMPYGNKDQIFSPILQRKRITENLILALDRGEYPQFYRGHPHDKIITAILSRMAEPDYKHLSQEIHQNYEHKLQEHEQAKAQELEDIRLANLGEIPTDGPLAKAYVYDIDPENPSRTSLMKLPVNSLYWLKDYIEKKKKREVELATLPPQAVADIARIIGQAGSNPTMPPVQNIGGI